MEHQGASFHLQQDQALSDAFGALGFQRCFADEILRPVDGEAKARFKRSDEGAKIVAPVFKALFDAAGVNGVVAHRLGAGLMERGEDLCGMSVRNPDLVAELSNETHAGQAARSARRLRRR